MQDAVDGTNPVARAEHEAGMSGLRNWAGSMLAAGGAAAVAGAFALLGVVWLTIALYGYLATLVAPPAAMALVGAACFLPLLALLVSRRRPPSQAPSPASPIDLDALPMARLVQSIDGLSKISPLAGVALAFGAAWVASRSPTSSALAAQLAAEAVDRLVRLISEAPPAPAATPADKDPPPSSP